MKVLITGSHFTPAQAVIKELQKEEVDIVYVGRKYTREGDKTPSVESQVLPGMGVKFISITTGRLQRTFTPYTIPSLLKIPFGMLQSFFIVTRERPDVVLSFGGYVSVPVIISAWLLSIPIIIHEQTLVQGMANEIGAWFADKIAVSFPNHEAESSSKVVLTGNPIRKEVLEYKDARASGEYKELLQKARKEKLPVILVTGGNQGSHVINRTVGEALKELTKEAFVIHQTGDSKFQDYEYLERLKEDLKNPDRYLPKKWIDAVDWGAVLKETDLVVSRAGANTLLELAFAAIPVLLIPLPYLYKNEQTVNARYFEKLGLATVLIQKELSGKSLLERSREMLKSLPELRKQAGQAKSIVITDAAKRLALETLLLAKRR